MLTLNRVTRRFPSGTVALQDASLTLNAGDFVALLGPSGCGKSTLLRLIAGLDQPDQGTLLWDGNKAPSPGEIGFVFQDPTLLPWATAEENVFLPLRVRGANWSGTRAAVRDMLDQVGLKGFEAARAAQLSGGMRMRVSIARALVTRPRLLLMDEPFAALDEFTRHRLQQDLIEVWRKACCTVVFVTHSIYEAAYVAERLILMSPRPGKVDREIRNKIQKDPDTRLSPAYVALVAEVSAAMDEIMLVQ